MYHFLIIIFLSFNWFQFWFLLVYTTFSNVLPLLYFKGCQSSPFALGQLTYWNIVHNILTPGLFEDLINHLQHYKLWGGAVSSLQSMLCCINWEWLADPAKNYCLQSLIVQIFSKIFKTFYTVFNFFFICIASDIIASKILNTWDMI